MATAKTLLQARKLTKDFGRGKGIFNVNFSVEPGEIVGFVGPNGAGKSTTINTITGLVHADSGNYTIFGQHANASTIFSLMPRIGIMFSEQTIDDAMTPHRIFQQAAELLVRDCRPEWQRLSGLLDLDVDKKVAALSLGNKKKVGVILALMHEPKLIIMDEPTSGLDPLIRERFIELLRERAAGGAGIFLSSHDLSEVQESCHRVIMLKDGKVVRTDTTEFILGQVGRIFSLVRPSERLKATLRQHGFDEQSMSHGELHITTPNHKQLLNILYEADFSDFYIQRPSLETAFKDIYG